MDLQTLKNKTMDSDCTVSRLGQGPELTLCFFNACLVIFSHVQFIQEMKHPNQFISRSQVYFDPHSSSAVEDEQIR